MKIQKNPTGIVLWQKNLSRNLVLPKKKIVEMYFKNGDFGPASLPSNALTGTLINKDPFTKKDSLAHHLL